MTYAVVFWLLAAYLAGMGYWLGGVGWLLLWPAVSFATVGVAYLTGSPTVFGKRPDGQLAPAASLLLLPYLLLTWLLWHGVRLVSREPCCHEVTPGLWLGRRALPHEIPCGVRVVVDLTAEFPEPRAVVRGHTYLCAPVLDATAPPAALVETLAARLRDELAPVYIHCASGHGRSALVAGAVLLARGHAADAADAVRLLRAARPGVRLKKAQRALLERLAPSLRPGKETANLSHEPPHP